MSSSGRIWRGGSRNRTSVTSGARPRGATLLICQDALSASECEGIRSRLRQECAQIAIEMYPHLCSRPALVTRAMLRNDTTALAVMSCTVSAASGVVREAVSEGLDPARVTALSFSTALHLDQSALRSNLIESICVAAARRADSLAVEPLAGREALHFGGALDRRSLLHPWSAPPRQTARVDPTSCLGANCSACVARCQLGALRIEGNVAFIDPATCRSCGVCVAYCPTSAISMPGAGLGGIAAHIEALVTEGVRTIRLLCDHLTVADEMNIVSGVDDVEASVTVPCVAMVSPGLLLGLRSRGVRVLVSPSSACKDTSSFVATLSFVNDTLDEIGRSHRTQCASDEVGDRNDDGMTQPVTNTSLQWSEPKATYAAIDVLLADSSGTGEPDVLLNDLAPTGVVDIDGVACSACEACVLACPTGAITFHEGENSLKIDLTSCIVCARCARVCPENAIDVRRGIVLRGPRTRVVVVKRGEDSWSCATCGALVDDDATLYAARRRLIEAGANEELLVALLRCTTCGKSPSHSSQGLTI